MGEVTFVVAGVGDCLRNASTRPALQRRGDWQGRWPAAGDRRLRRRSADARRSCPAGEQRPPDGHAAQSVNCDDVCELRLAHVWAC